MIFRYTLHMNLSFGAHLFFQTTFGGIVLKCERTLERCNVFDCVSLKLELHKPWVESNASFLQFQSKRVAVIINPICCILCIFIWVVLWSKLSTGREIVVCFRHDRKNLNGEDLSWWYARFALHVTNQTTLSSLQIELYGSTNTWNIIWKMFLQHLTGQMFWVWSRATTLRTSPKNLHLEHQFVHDDVLSVCPLY